MMDDDPAKLSGQRQRAEGKGQMAKAKTRPGLARQDKERPDEARQEPRDVDRGRRHRLNALYVARPPPASNASMCFVGQTRQDKARLSKVLTR